MTDTQLYLAIGLPIVTNAAMLTLAITLLGGRVGALERRIESVQNDLKDFYRTMAEHDKRLSKLEDK